MDGIPELVISLLFIFVDQSNMILFFSLSDQIASYKASPTMHPSQFCLSTSAFQFIITTFIAENVLNAIRLI
jgi:ABC-type arginine transport system permease subunit